MSVIGSGGAGAESASFSSPGAANTTNNSSSVQSIKSVAPMPIPIGQLLTGGKFGALTYNRSNSVALHSKSGLERTKGSVFDQARGNFGNLTTNARDGLIAMNIPKQTESSRDQNLTQTSDEMLEMANNITMKDMWAAA